MEIEFPTHHNRQQIDIIFVCRIQCTVAASFCTCWPTDCLNLIFQLTRVGYDGQSLEIPTVGTHRNFSITVHIRDALTHRKPGCHDFALSLPLASHFELARIVDHRFNTQYAPIFVVHLHPVFFHPMLYPCAGETFHFHVRENLAFETTVHLPTEECQDVLGAEAQCGVLQQLF